MTDGEQRRAAFFRTARSKSKSDYAYTPDDDPSHWKLDISDKDHAAAAKAALGKGFRGNKVKIPKNARAGVIRKVNEACRRFGIDPIKTSSVHFVNSPFNLKDDGGRIHLDEDYNGVRLYVTSKDSDEDLLWDEYFLRRDTAMIRAAELGYDDSDVDVNDDQTTDMQDQVSDESLGDQLDYGDTVSASRIAAYDPDYFDFITEDGGHLDENEIDEYLKTPDDLEWGWDDMPFAPQNRDEALDRYQEENHGESVIMVNYGQESEEPYVRISDDGYEGSDGQQFSSLDDAKRWLADNDPMKDEYVDASRRVSFYENTPYVMAFNESEDGWKRLSDQLIDPDDEEYADSDPDDVLFDVAYDFNVVLSPQPYSTRWALVGPLDSLRKMWDDVIYRNFSDLDFEEYAERYGVKPYEGSPNVDPMAEPYYGKDYGSDEDDEYEDDEQLASRRTSALSITQNDGSRIVVDDLSGAYGIVYDGPTTFDYEVFDSPDAVSPFLVDAAGSSDDAVQDVSDALNDLASQIHHIAEPKIDPSSNL